MKKYLYISAIFSLMSFIISCGEKIKPAPFNKGEKIPVKILEINKLGYNKTIETTGQLTTDDETLLSFKMGGVIKKIYVSEGDRIVKGQLLAELELTEIQATVAKVRRNYEKAERDFQRMRQLYQDSAITLESFQNTETGYEIAKEQLNEALFNLKYSEIRALENGWVLKKLANEGQLAQAGMPILQTNGAGARQWRVKASISDADWVLVKEGDEALITTDAEPNKIYQGKVIKKSAGTDRHSGVLYAEVAILDTEIKAASGMFARIQMITKTQTKSWQIPFEALIDANANKGFVFVADEEGIAKKKEVTIGEIKKTGVTILDGLNEREKIIISGSAYLRNLSKIKLEN